MSSILVIARRELRERSFIFFTAIGVAILPYLIALLPGASSFGRREIVGAIGLIGGCAFALGLAIVLGSSIVGRELSDGRLSFYFSKPIAPASIWFGKLTAALFTILVTFAIIAVPAYLGAGGHWRAVWTMDPALMSALLFGIALLLFVVSHAVTTMVRSRTPLVLLDFACLAVFAGAVWMLVRPLLAGFALKLATGVVSAIVVSIVLVLTVAPSWQLSRGRTDRRRNHIELSRVLWISVAVILLLAAGYIGWVVSASPADLISDFQFDQAPAGPWFMMTGEVKGRADYHPLFLINSANGSIERAEAPFLWYASFTRDGKAMYWFRPEGFRRNAIRGELWYRRLDDANAKPVSTLIPIGARTHIAVSDDLHRVVTLDNGILTIHDVTRGAIAGSVRMPESGSSLYASMYFVTPDVVRVLERSYPSREERPTTMRIYEFDAAHRSLVKTGEATFVTKGIHLQATEDGSKLLVGLYPSRKSAVVDAHTGATLYEVPEVVGWPHLLGDGSVVGFAREADGTHCRLVANGAVVRDIKLPDAKSTYYAREVEPGKVLVRLEGSKTIILNVRTGVIEKSVDHLLVMQSFGAMSDPRLAKLDPNQPIIGQDATRAFVRWNPATGEKTTLVKIGG